MSFSQGEIEQRQEIQQNLTYPAQISMYHPVEQNMNSSMRQKTREIYSFNSLKEQIGLSPNQYENPEKDISREIKEVGRKESEIRYQLNKDLEVLSHPQTGQNTLFNDIQDIYVQQIAVLQNKNDVLTAELNHLGRQSMEKIQILEDQNARMLKDLQQKSLEQNETLRRSEELQQLLDDSQILLENNRQEIEELTLNNANFETELTHLRVKHEQVQKQKNKYKKSRQDFKDQLASQEQQGNVQDEIITKLKEEVHFLTNDLNEKLLILDSLEGQLTESRDCQQMNQQLQLQCDDLQNRILDVQIKSEEYERNLNELNESLQQSLLEKEQFEQKYMHLLEQKTTNDQEQNKITQTLEQKLEENQIKNQQEELAAQKQKKKITEQNKQIEQLKEQLNKTTQQEDVNRIELKSAIKFLQGKVHDSSQQQDVPSLIILVRNLSQNLRKDFGQLEGALEKKTAKVTEQAKKAEVQEEENEKKAKKAQQLYQKIEEELKGIRSENEKLVIENGVNTRTMFEQNIVIENLKSGSSFHSQISRIIHYCSYLHEKLAQLQVIKSFTTKLTQDYLSSSEYLVSITRSGKESKKEQLKKKFRAILKSVLFVMLLKKKKNTHFILPQAQICTWLTLVSRKENHSQDQIENDILKNPERFILSLNSSSDVLQMNEFKVGVGCNLRKLISAYENKCQKQTNSDREQIDFFNAKVKEISLQLKELLKDREIIEKQLEMQVFSNKQQVITIQQLYGEIADQQFQMKLLSRNSSTFKNLIHNRFNPLEEQL